MNYAGKFDATISADGPGTHHTPAYVHIDSPHAQVPADAIIVPDAHLLFSADFKRSGVDLILSKDDHELVLHDYFKGEKRAPLASPDGAHLTGDLVNALTGHVQYSQAGGPAAASQVIGHVTKLAGNATAIRNGVSIILHQGDNVEKGDVVQSGSDSTLGITFIDGTVFGLSSNARMVLNEMVYDPNGSSNSSLMSLVAGTISFVAGETAKHGDMKIDTPVATMGIRGTAVLVQIDFDVSTSVSGAPPVPNAHFQVLIEPDGTTGSYILFDKTTLQPIATVNQAGQQINITNGIVSTSAGQLSPDAQKLVIDVFTQKFSATDTPTKSASATGSSTPPDNGQHTTTLQTTSKTPDGTPVTTFVKATDTTQQLTPDANGHIPQAPDVRAFGDIIKEINLTTGSAKLDTASGHVNYVDINAGDQPTVSTSFHDFTYTDAKGNVIATTSDSSKLNGLQIADIAATEVQLLVTQDPANKNNGSATWSYSIADSAFDFLGKGETLTLTYAAVVDNNYTADPSTEKTTKYFTITITGTNDVPVITSSAPTLAFTGDAQTGVFLVPATDPATGKPALTNGAIAFTDVDLTDTHLVTHTLKTPVWSGGAVPPGPLDAFTKALTADLTTDSTGTGNGVVTWHLAPLPDYLADFLPQGETLTLTYTITVTDSQGATVSQDLTVTLTHADPPDVAWIHPTDGLWSDGTNWETGNVPTNKDDVVIPDEQVVGGTGHYAVTITTAAEAKSVTLDAANTTGAKLIVDGESEGTLTTVGALTLLADSELDNSGTVSVGGQLELLNASVLKNSGTLDLAQGGDFKDQSSVTNSKTIDVSGGTLNILVDVNNTGGNLTVEGPAKLALNGATIAAGTVTNNGEFDLTGNAALQNGKLVNSHLIKVSGTGNALHNENVTANQTLEVTADSTLLLDLGTTIANAGGTVTVESGATLKLDGAVNDGATIDGGTVTINGTLFLDGNGVLQNGSLGNSGQFNVGAGGNALHNESVTANHALEVLTGGTLLLDLGTQITNSYGTDPVTGGTITVDGGATLKLGGTTITGGTINDYTNASGSILAGDIDVSGSSTINGNAKLNNGNVKVEANQILTLDNVTGTATTFTDTATGAALSVGHGYALTLQGGADVHGGSLFNAGTVQIETTGATFDGVDVVNTSDGVVKVDVLSEPPSPVTLTFLETSTITDGTLAIGNNGKVEIASGATTTWDSVTVDNGDEASPIPAGQIQVDGTLDLSGSTTISGGTLGIGGALHSTGTNAIDGTAITVNNAGTFDVTAGTMTIDAASSVTTTGTFEVNGGSLIVLGTLTGTATILGASLLELGAANSAANVTFAADATGILQLDHAKTFGGTVSGLDDNTLDLRDIGYLNSPTVSYSGTASGGTLSIFVGGIDVSDIKLSGDYLGVHWALADDGASHGTDVTEIPGAITAGLDSHGNATEGGAVTAIITDGGQSVTGATYDWQIFDTTKGWIDGSGTGVATANYTPGETDEGHALRVSLTFTDANGHSDTSTVSAGTVNGAVDTPVVSTPNLVTTTEDVAKLLTGLSVSTADGGADNNDTFTATLYVEHGTLALSGDLAATISGGDGHDLAEAVLITGSLADVNAALKAVTYTPASEYEGTDKVHFTATSTEDVGSSTSTAPTETTATITVNGTADTPVVSIPTPVTTTEDVAKLLSGLSVSAADGGTDNTDTFTAKLYVEHGTLALGSGSFVVTHSGTGTSGDLLTITGSLTDMNLALAKVTYTPASEFEGTDKVHFTATSTEDVGSSTSAPATETTATITVNPVADHPVVTASAAAINEDGTSALTLALTNAAGLFENVDDSVTVTVSLSDGAKLHGTGVTDNGNGTFTLTASSAADFNGLTITPASEFEGTVAIGVTAIAHDGLSNSAVGSTTASLTVNPVSDTPSVAATTTAVALNENDSNVAITGVSVTPAAGDDTDPVTLTLQVANGKLLLDGSADLAAKIIANGSGTVTVSGLASDVNTVLGTLKYTVNGEFEGSDTLHVTATSTDGGAAASAVSTEATVALTVNPVSDTPSVAVAAKDTAVATNENAKVAIPGVSVAPAAGDDTDPVTVTLQVANGTLSLDGSADLAAKIIANGSGTVTVSGLASDVNKVLATLTYNPNGEFEGSDALHVTATSTDGNAAPSAASAEATVALTVNPVVEAPALAGQFVNSVGDDFSGTTLDPTKWHVYVPQHSSGANDGSVSESGGALHIQDRGILQTVAGFTPTSATPLHTSFTWSFGDTGDYLVVTDRTDGATESTYGGAVNGISFVANWRIGDPGALLITDNASHQSVRVDASLNAGTLYDVSITDDGAHQTFVIKDHASGQTVASATGSFASAAAGNLVTITNREGNDGPHQDTIANLSISNAYHGSENGTVTLAGLTALTDADVTDTLALSLSGFPDGATFSAGVLGTGADAGHWVISASQIASLGTSPLTMTPPADYNGNFTLHVDATVTDPATGGVTDTKTFSNDLAVTVDAVNDATFALTGLNQAGNAVEHQQITAVVTDTDAPASGITYTFQAFDGTHWNNVQSGTSASYTPTEAVEGEQLRVNVSYADTHGNAETRLINAGTVQESTTNDLVVTSSTAAPVSNGGTFSIGGTVAATDVDNGESLTWSVAGGASVASENFTYGIHELTVVKNINGTSTTIFDDTFNGRAPPAGPNFLVGTTTPPVYALSGGTIVAGSASSAAQLEGAQAAPVGISLGSTTYGDIVYGPFTTLLTGTSFNSPPGFGLRSGQNFSASTVFDLVNPADATTRYGIRLSDRQNAGNANDQSGTETVDLSVVHNVNGGMSVQLNQFNFVTGTVTTLQTKAIVTGQTAGITDNEIKLTLSNSVANNGHVVASYQLMGLNGSGVEVADGGPVTFTSTGQIFDNEDWTRAQFYGTSLAGADTAPNVTSNAVSFLQGTYGTLAVNQSTGSWNYYVNPALAKTIAFGQTAVDHFRLTATDTSGNQASTPVDITVKGTVAPPVVTNIAGVSTNENTALTLKTLNVSFADAGNDTMTATLNVGHGALSLGSTSGLTVSGAGTGASPLILTGTLSAIDAALASGVVYTPTNGYTGADALSVTAADGAFHSNTASVGITVVSTNPTYLVTSTADDTTTGTLRSAILYANAHPGTVITFASSIANSTITLASELPLITGNGTAIDGGTNHITVSGNDQFRIFFVGDTSSAIGAIIENLTLAHGAAKGGNGASGGGGGAGFGGAIFVSSHSSLSLINASLTSDSASGGNGAAGIVDAGGGGGGMGGNGGIGGNNGSLGVNSGGGGGGGFGIGANGGGPYTNGLAGEFTGGASGGSGSVDNGGSPGGTGGANGGGGGGGGYTGAGGGGGVGGSSASLQTGGSGGFGGGGGGSSGVGAKPAGSGGFGGGGGAPGLTGSTGGDGGFGGGGGVRGHGGFGGGDGAFGSGLNDTKGGGGGAGMGGGVFVESGGSITIGGTLTVNGDTVTKGTGAGGGADGRAFGSGIFLQGSTGTITFAPGAGQTETVANSIADQSGSGGVDNSGTGGANNAGVYALTLNGAGTLILAGTDTYKGATTVSAGTLEVDGSVANSAVTVQSGATLDGVGTTGAVTVQNGGTLAPGDAGAGLLNTGNLSLASGSTLAVELGGTTAGTGYDQVKVTGTVALNGATLSTSLINSFVPTPGSTFTIIDNEGSGAVSGTFAGLAEGATFVVGGTTYQISYVGGDGNDVTLKALGPNIQLIGQTLLGSASDQAATAVDYANGHLYLTYNALPVTQTASDNSSIVSFTTGANAPTQDFSEHWTYGFFNGIAADASKIYAVGGSSPFAGLTHDSVGGWEDKTILALFDANGTAGNNPSPATGYAHDNFFSYNGVEIFQNVLATTQNGNTVLYAVGSGQPLSYSGYIIAEYNSSGTLLHTATDSLASFSNPGGSSANDAVEWNGAIWVVGSSDHPNLGDTVGHATVWTASYDLSSVVMHEDNIGSASGNFASAAVIGNALYAVGSDNNNGGDYLVAKYNTDGSVAWNHSFGGTGADTLNSAVALNGHLYVVGSTTDASSGHTEGVLMEISTADGSVISTQTYGGALYDTFNSITTDGHYLYVAGESRSFTNAGNGAAQDNAILLTYKTGPIIATDHFSVAENHQDGSAKVTGLSVSEAGASPTDLFTISAVTEQAGSSVTLPQDASGPLTLTQINADLTNGITYNPGLTPPQTDKLAFTITDNTTHATDTVNFVFSQAATGPVTLTGTAGKDLIFASGEGDTLTGNGGLDQFVFKPNGGSNVTQTTITDFVAGLDKIDVRQFGTITASNLPTETQQGNDTLVTLDSNDKILLQHVVATNLHASDFIIHG